MRCRWALASLAMLGVAGCGDAPAPKVDCTGVVRVADPGALGYASLSRLRDEGFIETFALVGRPRPENARWTLDDGRACVRFSGTAPDVRLVWRTRDDELARHLRDERQIEGLR